MVLLGIMAMIAGSILFIQNGRTVLRYRKTGRSMTVEKILCVIGILAILTVIAHLFI